MSCITIIGMEKRWALECDVPLPRSAPTWTDSKRKRLEGMALSEDPTRRAIAASHPRLPSNRLLALLVDDSPEVRRAAVKNTAITAPMLEIATHDDNKGIAAYAKMILGGMNNDG